MGVSVRFLIYFNRTYSHATNTKNKIIRNYSWRPFLDFYEKTTGNIITLDHLSVLKKKHPNIDKLSSDRIQCTLNILQKFGISAEEACSNLHLFSMNPITMDNYGEILKECRFTTIIPKYIIRYHTLVRTQTIAQLKKQGLLSGDLILQEVIQNSIEEWPIDYKSLRDFPDSTSTILAVRIHVLEQYLQWKLSITSEEFNKYCRNYLPLKHKPMCDIRESINLAQNDIKLDTPTIRRNGFIISSDPINTKLILENVATISGLDIRDAIKIEPAILKNNYNSILHIKETLEENGISNEAQRRCLKVYCMCPKTVKERFEELRSLKEYQVLSTNPRVLSMIVHKKKMMNRLTKIQSAKKQCFSLNHLVSSSKVFSNYINSFGSKVCSRDIAVLISSSLESHEFKDLTEKELLAFVSQHLKRHKYWLHVALKVIEENLQFLKKIFSSLTILNNCQLLLYPVVEVEHCISYLIKMRKGEIGNKGQYYSEGSYNSLRYSDLTDEQLLSLVLYEIEKKYHFSGDGIWVGQDNIRADSAS